MIRSTSTLPKFPIRFSGKWLIHLILFILAVIWLVPSIGLLTTSFRPREAISDSGWWTSFSEPRFTLDNYEYVIDAQGIGDAFINSFLITVPSTLLPILLAALAAYSFAWIKFWGRDAIFLLLMALLVVPIQTALVPALQFTNKVGLTGSYVGLWVVHTGFGLPFAIFLLRNFFVSIPRELLEAARIDGGSERVIFTRIVIPLSVPALASLAIFQFMWVWNDLLVALVFMNDPAKQPITVRMQAMLGTYATEWDIMSASAFISMAIPLLVFFAMQRYFVVGLTAGAVKA
jgi:alpha-glucoside transport system permease protein